VFEIYTQATPLLSQAERTLVITSIGVGLILLCHYAFLLLTARRARGIIESQQRTIRERTAALEKVSAEMLQSEELEKRKLAAALQEGVAQTLAAIKARIEENLAPAAAVTPAGRSLVASIPVLQDAIQKVCAMAMELRPSSLDDIGLLPTIDWFCRELERRYPEFVIDQEITLDEQDVPAPLKVVVYRVMESAFKGIALQCPDTDRIRLGLRREGGTVILTIDDIPNAAPGAAAARRDAEADVPSRLAALQERASLSGGSVSVARNEAGGTALRAAWSV
jgi:signal transduction histidine kinase